MWSRPGDSLRRGLRWGGCCSRPCSWSDPLLLDELLADEDELLVDEESLLSSRRPTGGRAPPRRI